MIYGLFPRKIPISPFAVNKLSCYCWFAMNAIDTINFPKTLFVKSAQGRKVKADVVHTKDRQLDRESYSIELQVREKKVGELFFYIAKDRAHIYVTHLQNTTIVPKKGIRIFSQVGTALINLLKRIAKKQGIACIKLSAVRPPFTVPPQNDNLKEFYLKMGFTVDKERNMTFAT